MCLPIHSISDADKLQSDLNSISAWSEGNILSPNALKCKSMSYHRKYYPLHYDCKRLRVYRPLIQSFVLL